MALSAVLLMAVVGCINITIKMAGPQAGPPPERGSEDGKSSIYNGRNNVPTPGGGIFVPVQNATLGGGSTTICGQPVPGQYARFSNPYLTQTPDADVTGFLGTVVDLTASQIIPNTHYYLQWYVNANPTNQGCCTNVTGSTTEVGCKIIPGVVPPGRPHRFTAFWKAGNVPPTGHQIQLQGAWIKP